MRQRDRMGEEALRVRTFGRFSIAWKDTMVVGGTSYNESQFTYLMQILLHAGKKGVSRSELEEALFEGRELNNVRHATQSVIYNAKKRLRRSGLPDVNYIEQRDGIFYWTDQIPVVEDAAQFEKLWAAAESALDQNDRLKLYLDACYCYTGEFLPALAGMLWAAQEAKRYQAMFCSCVEKAAEMLRDFQDYSQMEELGNYAARIDPLANWELITMEALAAMGRYDDARKLYDETVEFYMQEQGLRPSKKMMEMLNRLAAQMQHSYEVLDNIQDHLSGHGEGPSGGYVCSYPIFQGIYRMIERMLERGGQSVYLMLCTVVDGKGNPMKDGPVLEELSQRLEQAIQNSVRNSDVISRYGRGQYLVLLINTTRENCTIVQRRINEQFIKGRQRSGVEYFVNSVFSSYSRP